MDANIKNLQDAMEWLDRSIRDEAELDDEMSNEHAIQLGFIQNMLAKFPRRNCDVGTAEEQYRRHDAFCDATRKGMSGYHCDDAPRCVFCFSKWAQMPYEEGGKR